MRHLWPFLVKKRIFSPFFLKHHLFIALQYIEFPRYSLEIVEQKQLFLIPLHKKNKNKKNKNQKDNPEIFAYKVNSISRRKPGQQMPTPTGLCRPSLCVLSGNSVAQGCCCPDTAFASEVSLTHQGSLKIFQITEHIQRFGNGKTTCCI